MMNDTDLDTLAFRHQLMRVSDQLESDEVDTLKSLFTRKLPKRKLLRIKEGYQLFAALEDRRQLTKDNYRGMLTDLFQALERDPEVSVAEFEKGLVESRRAHFAFPPICTLTKDAPEHLDEAYSQCLVHLGDRLAREDGSLQKVVYMCPQLPLKDMEAIDEGHTLFRKLEEKDLIRCWCLPYLYVCFLAAERRDLCHEVERRSELAMQSLQLQPTPVERDSPYLGSLFAATAIRDAPYTGPSTSVGSRITVFDHRLYCWVEAVLSSKFIFGILALAILLGCLLPIVNFPLDKNRCNIFQATHNALAKLTGFGTIPAYVIWRISRTIDRDKLKSCKLLSRAWKKEHCKVFERVISRLADNEHRDLNDIPTVEKVNIILTRKLYFIAVTCIVQSGVSAIGFFLLHAASWYTFAGLTDTLSRCFCLVMILASFASNALVGAVLTLYLFEMRVREYLLYVIHHSEKSARLLRDDARQLKKVLDERWWETNIALKVLSFFYLAVLVSRLYFDSPFFCAGGRVISFTEEDLEDLPRYWLFWVIISFTSYLLAYSYWTFIYGRIVAFVALVVDVSFVLVMRVGGNIYPKWAGFTQIIVVLCPLAINLSTHHIACVHIWLQTYLKLKSPGQKSQPILPVLQLVVRKPLFLLNFVMCMSLVILSVFTVVTEYLSITAFSNSTAF